MTVLRVKEDIVSLDSGNTADRIVDSGRRIRFPIRCENYICGEYDVFMWRRARSADLI